MSNIISVYKKLVVSLFIIIAFFVGTQVPFSTQPSLITPRVAHAQSCQVPTQVQNVSVVFPSCVGDVCNFTQGSCSWTNVSGATGESVTITEVETNTVVQTQTFDTTVTSTTFPVKETNTYRCDVAATNSCGTGPAGTNSLLCRVDAGVATPTTAPTAIPGQPTAVPIAQQPLPVSGTTENVLLVGLGSFILIGLGLSLFIL